MVQNPDLDLMKFTAIAHSSIDYSLQELEKQYLKEANDE
jgi:hypothetical protein